MFQRGLSVPEVPRALGALVSSRLGVHNLLLAPCLPLPPPIVAVLKHIQALGVQRPVAAFTGPTLLSGHLNKAVVEGEVVADGVLPALLVVVIKGEPVHDELVDAAERCALLRCALDGHGDERNVTVGRLLRRLLMGRYEAQTSWNDPSAIPTVQIDQWGAGEAQGRGRHSERRQAAVVESHDAEECPGES